MDQLIIALVAECQALLDSEDDTGCSEDLTVVDKTYIESIRRLVAELNIKKNKVDLLSAMTNYGGG